MRGCARGANVPGVSRQTPRLLIAGGGIAAVEALLAFRALAEERVRIELVAPGRWFSVPAYSVGGPLALGRTPRYDLEESPPTGVPRCGATCSGASMPPTTSRSPTTATSSDTTISWSPPARAPVPQCREP